MVKELSTCKRPSKMHLDQLHQILSYQMPNSIIFHVFDTTVTYRLDDGSKVSTGFRSPRKAMF